MNDELLKRRAEAKREDMKRYGERLTQLRKHLASGDYDLARQLAGDLRDTLVFGEVIKAFEEKPETFHCEDCGKNIEGLAFRKDTLSWIRPHFCDSCEQREKEKEINRQKRAFANFVDRRMETILKVVGVEGLLLNSSYEGFTSALVQTCRRSVTGKHGLYICGGVGRGKSWLSVALLKELIRTPQLDEEISRRVTSNIYEFRNLYRFVYVPWLLMEIKSSYDNNSGKTEQGLIEEYTNIPVLVLDDIGSERPTEWVREKLNMIIYFRNNRGLKTLYTSNIAPDELQERLDERITSRILQQCEIIHLTGPDRRRQ
jgi:DNA replication protein DnaC